MDAVLAKAFDYGIVAVGFLFLLYFVTNQLNKTFQDGLRAIADTLSAFGVTLKEVSNTLTKIDLRIEQLEKRVIELESEGK